MLLHSFISVLYLNTILTFDFYDFDIFHFIFFILLSFIVWFRRDSKIVFLKLIGFYIFIYLIAFCLSFITKEIIPKNYIIVELKHGCNDGNWANEKYYTHVSNIDIINNFLSKNNKLFSDKYCKKEHNIQLINKKYYSYKYLTKNKERYKWATKIVGERFGIDDFWYKIFPVKQSIENNPKYFTLVEQKEFNQFYKDYKRIAPGLDFKILFSIFTVLEITFAVLPAIIIFSLTWIIYCHYYYRKSYEKWMEFIKEENKDLVFQQKALLILLFIFFIYNIIYLINV